MSDEQPRINQVTTFRGDSGTTYLADGNAYVKSDDRIELIGSLDELNCVVGLAAVSCQSTLRESLYEIQARIFDIGAAVATGEPQPYWQREAMRLTRRIEKINATLEPLAEFVLPGGNEANARLHIARATARQCERTFWRLDDKALIEAATGVYLNRLSDFLFVAARSVCAEEVQWRPLKE